VFKAFNRLKHILHPPILGEPFERMCDSFDYAIEVVLGQRVVYYATHTLNEAQLNYTIIEKEFLPVVFSFEIF